MACPNFNDPKNKELISKIGIDEFYNKWLAFDGNIPENIYDGATTSVLLNKQNISNDYQTTANTNTIDKVKSFLASAGVTVEVTNSVIDKYGANAVADSYNKLVQVAEGQEGVLGEEAAHIFTELLPENSELLQAMMKDITKYDIYKQTYNQYKSDPNYQTNGKVDFKKIKKEAIGKLIAEYVIKQNEGVEANFGKTWWASIIDYFKNLFNSSRVNPYSSSASSILSNDIGQLTNSNPENSLYYKKIDENKNITSNDQKEIVDSMIYDMYMYLQEAVGASTLINLDDLDISNSVIRNMKEAVKDDFNALRAVSTSSVALTLLDSLDSNFDAYYKLAVENFSAINFKINPEVALETDVEESDDSKYDDKIYAKDALESNLRDGLRKDTKMLLSIVPKRSEDGKIAKNKLGLPIFEDFNNVYTYVSQQLADSKNLDEMVNKLTYLSITKPSLKYIIDRLKQVPNVDDPFAYKAQSLRNSFFSSMQNHYYDFFTVNKKTKYDSFSDSNDTELSVFNTNKRSLDRVIFNDWKQVNDGLVAKETVPVKLAEFLKNNYEQLNAGNEEALNNLGKYLATTGVSVDNGVMKVYYDAYVSNKNNKSSFISFLLDPKKASVVTIINSFHSGNDIFKKPSHDEKTGNYEKAIKQFALIQSNLSTDYAGASFVNGENKQIYAINLNNHTQENFQSLIEGDSSLDDYKKDGFFTNMQLLKTVDKGIQTEELLIYNFDTLFDNDTKDATPFNKLNTNQIEVTKLNLFLNNSNDVNSKSKVLNGWGNFLVPTPSDRSQTRVARLQRVQSVNESVLDENNNLKTNSGFYNWLIGDIEAEFSRILRESTLVNKGVDLLDNYHVKKDNKGNRTSVGNAFFFCNHPYLNKLLYSNGYPTTIAEIHSGIAKNLDLSSPEVSSAINNEFKAIFKQELKHLVDNDVVRSFKSADGSIKIAMQQGTVPSAFNRSLGSNPNAFIQSYIANQIYANNELTKLSIGDIAQYKIDPVKMKFTDANKRSGLPYTPGSKLNVRSSETSELGGISPTFNVAPIADIEQSSKTMEDLAKVITSYNLPQEQQESWNKILSPYVKSGAMNIADAQGFCTLNRYAQILDGQGQLTPQIQESITRLNKSQGTQADIQTVLNPIKGFYFGNLNKDGRLVKFNLKYSLVPIIPQSLSDDNVLKQWLKDSPLVDEFVFESGIKAGNHNLNNSGDTKLKYVTLNNKDYRIPQVVPYKDKTEINFGSQIMKLIDINNDDERLKAVYQNLLNDKIQEGHQSVMEKMSNLDDVVKWLQQQLKSSNRSLPDMIEEAVQIVKFRDSGGNISEDTLLSLSYPSIKRTIEAIFLSGFRNDINKLKTPGVSAVQVSSFGLFGTDNTLKFVQPKFDKKGNLIEITPAEVVVSPQYFLNILKKKGIDTSLLVNKDGSIKEDLIREDLRKIIIYRIPTQGKNSMLPCRIKSFTHPSSGSIIYLPNEVVVQAGSDFDIDKVYIEMMPVGFDEQRQMIYSINDNLDAQIFDAHYKFITYPTMDNYKELITPNSSDLLKEYRENLSKYNKKGGLNYWFLPSTQEDLRQKNKAGKDLIGIWSQYSTHIPFRQFIKAKLTTPIQALGKQFTSLHDKMSVEGNLISEEIAQMQTGAVDNAKDPILGDLNYNTFTSEMANLMVSSGMGLKFTTDFINTPAIKQLTSLYFKYDAQGKGALQKAVTDLLKQYGYKGGPVIKDLVKGFNLNLSMDLVEQSLENSGNTEIQTNILRWFLSNKNTASSLNSFIQSSQTNNGLKGSISDGQVFANEFEQNINNNQLISFDETKFNQHSINTFYELGIKSPLNDVIPTYFIDTVPLVDSLIKNYSNDNADIANKLKMDFVTYIHSRKGSWFGDQLTPAKVTSLLKGDNILKNTKEIIVNNDLSYNDWANKIIARISDTKEVLRKHDIDYNNDLVKKLIKGTLQVAMFNERDVKNKNKQYIPFINELEKNGFKQVVGKEFLFTKDGLTPEELYENYKNNQQAKNNTTSRVSVVETVSNKSIARRFVEFYNNEKTKEKQSDNKYQSPSIFKLFTTEFNSKNNNGIDLLKFNNTLTKSLDRATQSQMADEFYDLYENGNEETKEFIKAIILNNFLLHGFQSTPDSMIKFIHTKFFVEFGLNTFFKSHEQLLRSGIDNSSLQEYYNIPDFITKFYVNNMETLVASGLINIFKSEGVFQKSEADYGVINGKLYEKHDGEPVVIESPITKNYLDIVSTPQYTDKLTLTEWKEVNNFC